MSKTTTVIVLGLAAIVVANKVFLDNPDTNPSNPAPQRQPDTAVQALPVNRKPDIQPTEPVLVETPPAVMAPVRVPKAVMDYTAYFQDHLRPIMQRNQVNVISEQKTTDFLINTLATFPQGSASYAHAAVDNLHEVEVAVVNSAINSQGTLRSIFCFSDNGKITSFKAVASTSDPTYDIAVIQKIVEMARSESSCQKAFKDFKNMYPTLPEFASPSL